MNIVVVTNVGDATVLIASPVVPRVSLAVPSPGDPLRDAGDVHGQADGRQAQVEGLRGQVRRRLKLHAVVLLLTFVVLGAIL